jgi:arsenite-transporting ATPase
VIDDELRALSSPREPAARRVILFGGKGGVGKTTLASHAANVLGAILLKIESLDAHALYRRFLDQHLEQFIEIGDRGTYLDREELRRFFELSLPGVDELMAWMHIGELVEQNPDRIVVVDTAPTGHTLRMLSSSEHFRQFALALDAMQEKHRAMVRQFTRRESRDALDAFIDEFDARAKRYRALIDTFIPVTLSEPWVVEQTLRLIGELEGIDVPFVVLNRAVHDVDCDLDRERAKRDAAARARFKNVVDFPRSCVPLWSRQVVESSGRQAGPRRLDDLTPRRLLFFAGKGGVGKTTCASSMALQLARTQRVTLLSVDPAHSVRDVFAHEPPPANLTVETIDTKAKWRQFRDTLGQEIDRALNALTPSGMTLGYDAEAMQRLVEIAPPGADELFAIIRLADLIGEDAVIVDTAPTGHFLRLLELPQQAGEWVREFMRLLLRYRDLIPPGSLGEELVRASRALKDLDETLRSDQAVVIVVTRPEPLVIEETKRLIDTLTQREIRVAAVIANYVTPQNECKCDQTMRGYELEALAALDVTHTIERSDEPPVSLERLERIGSALVRRIES